MLEQNISVIGNILKVIGGFFIFSAALCGFHAVFQNEKHEPTREWFRKNWEKDKSKSFDKDAGENHRNNTLGQATIFEGSR